MPTARGDEERVHNSTRNTEEGMFSISVGLFLALLLQSLWKLHVPVSVWKHDNFPRGMYTKQAARKLLPVLLLIACECVCLPPPLHRTRVSVLPLPGLPFSGGWMWGRRVPRSVAGRIMASEGCPHPHS